MTRRRRRKQAVETRLAALESEQDHEERIFVLSIGGDGSEPSGWLTPEEYEQHFGELPDSDSGFDFMINGESGPKP